MSEFIPADPFDLVIFGGTGDLAKRKLLPALFHRDADGQLGEGSRIIASSRKDLAREDFVAMVEEALRQHLGLGKVIVAGGSYGGFLAQEYVLAYPENVLDDLTNRDIRVITVDAFSIAKAAGEVRTANVALVGALSVHLPVDAAVFERIIESRVPERFREENMKAFAAGREAGNE